jgi:hypothetical protein
MNYRNIEYQSITWQTWNDETIDSYQCDDKVLLENTDTTSFSVDDREQMHNRIDFYLDNKPMLMKSRELEVKAGEFFYETLKYKGD